MTAFPTYGGLDIALAFAVSLFSLLVFSGLALLAGFIWCRKGSAGSRGPTIVLRIALVSSIFLFAATLLVCGYALVTGFDRGPLDFFSIAFWPATSGVIAFLALRQIRRSTSSPNDRNALPPCAAESSGGIAPLLHSTRPVAASLIGSFVAAFAPA